MDFADLSEADLGNADPRDEGLSVGTRNGADLSDTYLVSTDLSGANLRSVNLSGANLQRARGLTDDQLAEAGSLEGATMPNGQTYEDWLKYREDRKENVENE